MSNLSPSRKATHWWDYKGKVLFDKFVGRLLFVLINDGKHMT